MIMKRFFKMLDHSFRGGGVYLLQDFRFTNASFWPCRASRWKTSYHVSNWGMATHHVRRFFAKTLLKIIGHSQQRSLCILRFRSDVRANYVQDRHFVAIYASYTISCCTLGKCPVLNTFSKYKSFSWKYATFEAQHRTTARNTSEWRKNKCIIYLRGIRSLIGSENVTDSTQSYEIVKFFELIYLPIMRAFYVITYE